MNKDRLIGWGLLTLSVIVIIVYGYILYWTNYYIELLKLTGMVAIIGVFGLIGWIGYTLARASPTKPIEEIEKEIEEELGKLKQESAPESQSSSQREKE